ncbi:MAG: zf-TFIIB domain-containing protein [Proteobacteria bacterium]|nr:zf-TFIIB domain-containing protein [Pseudomonadota bacterium]
MQCPVDNTQLQMMDRQGVEIDYCPKCRGVWLDRGELDKLIERAAPPVALSEPARAEAPREYRGETPREYREEPRHRDDRDYRDDDRYGHGKPYRKRKGFLSEIFDFD